MCKDIIAINRDSHTNTSTPCRKKADSMNTKRDVTTVTVVS